jgi:hypothetical protein
MDACMQHMNEYEWLMKVYEGEMIGRRVKEGIRRVNKMKKRAKEWM